MLQSKFQVSLDTPLHVSQQVCMLLLAPRLDTLVVADLTDLSFLEPSTAVVGDSGLLGSSGAMLLG